MVLKTNILELKIKFSSVNVLDNPEIREGIKTYSKWPTIPQLFVNGELLGGCDIAVESHNSGELKNILNKIN